MWRAISHKQLCTTFHTLGPRLLSVYGLRLPMPGLDCRCSSIVAEERSIGFSMAIAASIATTCLWLVVPHDVEHAQKHSKQQLTEE